MNSCFTFRHFHSVLILLILLLMAMAQLRVAAAGEVSYGKSRVTVPITWDRPYLFRFSQEVKTITGAGRVSIRPSNPDEPDYSVLAVRAPVGAQVENPSFILADGSVVRTQIVISEHPAGKKTDTIFDFKPHDDLGDSNPNLSEHPEKLTISELDLMRAMILGAQVSSFEVFGRSQAIPTESPDFTATLVREYRGQNMNGYVYLLKTEGRKLFQIDLNGLSIGQPNLAILGQVDHEVIGGELPADRQTYLRIVAKPGASSGKVILPVAIRKEEIK